MKGGCVGFWKIGKVGLSANLWSYSKRNRREIKKIGVSARKFRGMNPPKKKNFCVLCLKLAIFFMIAPPTTFALALTLALMPSPSPSVGERTKSTREKKG
jgi:hypothetical protein